MPAWENARIARIERKERRRSIGETTREQSMAAIRQVFSDGQGRDRETASRDVVRALGFERLGPNIRKILEGDLIAAVRRGILENERGELRRLTRTIADYDRAFLKEMFLAAIGPAWRERGDAIRAAARHLGFQRAGPAIHDALASVINGLLREGRLEKDGGWIRKT